MHLLKRPSYNIDHDQLSWAICQQTHDHKNTIIATFLSQKVDSTKKLVSTVMKTDDSQWIVEYSNEFQLGVL